MTGYELASIILTVLTVLVAVGVAVIYHRQVREMRWQNTRLAEGLRIATTDTLEAGFARVTAAFITYPRLRVVFYEDEAAGEHVSSMTNDILLQANALAESILSLFSSAFRASREGDVAELPWFADYVEGSFINSRHLREYALRRRAWIDPHVLQIAEKVEARTDKAL